MNYNQLKSKKCLIYARVKNDQHSISGYSIADQVKECAKYADRRGYIIAGIITDLLESANNLTRSGLQKMIARCKADRDIDIILVQNLDRLIRNVEDYIWLQTSLEQVGTKIMPISQLIDDDHTPESMIMDIFIGSISKKMRGVRISAGIKAAKAERKGSR